MKTLDVHLRKPLREIPPQRGTTGGNKPEVSLPSSSELNKSNGDFICTVIKVREVARVQKSLGHFCFYGIPVFNLDMMLSRGSQTFRARFHCPLRLLIKAVLWHETLTTECARSALDPHPIAALDHFARHCSPEHKNI